ncbi:hypothetical protein OHR68_34765 [Spirillospora sp. NBC_00431]
MTDSPDEPQKPGTEVVPFASAPRSQDPPPPAAEPGPAKPEPEAREARESKEAGEAKEGRAFDGRAREIGAPAGLGDQERDETDTSDAAEGPESDDRSTAGYRDDFYGTCSRFDVGGDAEFGMFAGRDLHYHDHTGKGGRTSKRPVRPEELAAAEAWYVSTGTEPELRRVFGRTHLVFLRVRPGDGGGTTALAVLDELTGRNRHESRVRRLSPVAPRLLMAGVEKGAGLLVDALGTNWTAGLRRAEADELANRLAEKKSFMVVLVDANATLPVTDLVVHTPPDPEQVFNRYLAFLHVKWQNGRDGAAPARTSVDVALRMELRDLLKEIEEGPPEAREWYEAVRSPGTDPREAVIFAQEWWNWYRLRVRTGAGEDDPPFPKRNLIEQARNLLRSKGGSDGSPVRQAYVIAAAVLDDVSMSDITESAGRLAAGFSRIERPGVEARREVFGEPFRSWVEQLSAGPSPSLTDPVWRRQRELSRVVVEVAWSEYDVVRDPLREWLVDLCAQGGVRRVRAVQALALIAAKDYGQIRDKVLRDWSKSGKNWHHECAAWLLEAMILFGSQELRRAAEKELRSLARSLRKSERAVALRAYGTRITDVERLDRALEDVHGSIGVLRGRFGTLIAQCLRDLYELGHREPVLDSLVKRVRWLPIPPVQEQAARTVVRIARLRSGGGDHDLLRFAHTLPHGTGDEDEGLTLAGIAELWWYACDMPGTRTEAWRVLGRWHADCVAHPELTPTFEALLEAMARVDRAERSADGRPMRTRIGLYREFWIKRNTEQER